MIGKKVANPRRSGSKAARVSGLLDYIAAPELNRGQEKCLYSAGRGFLSVTQEGKKAEMTALAQDAVRSRDPVNHYILSWREGEQPTWQNVEQAVDVLLDELGLKSHQCLYGLHADTDNLHLHIAVNRVHPDTLKVIKPNRGFDIEALHKAVARIEHEQGWERERNGRYHLQDNGELGRYHAEKQRQPGQRQQDMEHRTGEKSGQRIAIEQAAPMIQAATSWREVHDSLAKKGMRYERTGSGALVFVGDVGIKASQVDRAASLTRLQHRLGPYEPAHQEKPNVYHRHQAGPEPHLELPRQLAEHRLHNLSECRLANHGKEEKSAGILSSHARAHRREFDAMRRQREPARQLAPEPLQPGIPGWNEYIRGRKAHDAARDAATLAQRARQAAQRSTLAASQKVYRAELFGGSWTGKGDALNALRSMVAAAQAVEKIGMRERQQEERKQLAREHPPYPGLEQWQRQQQHLELADAWRYRHSEPAHIERGQGCRDYPEKPAMQHDLRAYVARVQGGHVHYTRKDQKGDAASFVDKGERIDIHDWRRRDSVLAALQLGQQKWGSLCITGGDNYKALCATLAAEHGFKITNPELQERIARERERERQRRQERVQNRPAPATDPEPLRQFGQYHAALGAERYRVTSVRLHDDGSRQTFLLDPHSLTADEIAQRMPDLQRLQQHGEHVHYTPLSEKKHHLLIDAMSPDRLDKLVADGYRPAAVLHTGAGHFQAIITVSKLGTAHDDEVGKRLAERLNQAYGDPALSGGIHPHRAPGFENRQPGDGSRPAVRLHASDGRECIQALALSRQIDTECQRQTERQAGQTVQHAPAPAMEKATAGSAIDAYRRHHRDVVQRHKGGDLVLSRVDAMVAVRMRVTGHSQVEIEGTLRQCAPATRQKDEGRDWNGYARRTAAYAFSAAGGRQAADLEKYRPQWEKLEGRGQVRERSREPEQDRGHDMGR